MNHYLHHSTPEHDAENKHHLEKYLVEVFRAYDENNLSGQQTNIFDITAEVLFYYQKKFTHLDNLYTQLASNSTPDRFHFFIRCLKIVNLEKLIWEHEKYQLIQTRFRLKGFGREPDVLQLATQLWDRFDVEAKHLMLRHAFSYRLLFDHSKVQNTSVQGDTKGTSLIDRILSLPLELRRQIIDAFFEEFGMTEYAEQKMRDTITSTASTLWIPHTDEQINKAFHLLLKGITFWNTHPSIFTPEQVDGKTRLAPTPATLTKEESNTIKAYLRQATSQQLKIFDVSKKFL